MLPAIIAGTAFAKSPLGGFILKSGFLIAIAFVSYLIVRKVINMVRRSSAISNYSDVTSVDGKATQYANQLYSAMVRTNAFWNKWFGDGTDINAIYSTAAEMHQNEVSFLAVSKKFKALFNEDLLKMLNADLDSQELLRFNSILGSGLSGIRINNLLKTNNNAYVLDEKLKPMQLVRASTNLGMHVESIVFDTGKRYDGFEYQGKMRYVDADYVDWINQ